MMCALLLLASCQAKEKKQDKTSTPSRGDAALRSEAPDSDAPVGQAPRAPLPPLPDPLPGKRTDMTTLVGTTARAAIGDFDGNKQHEIALADEKTLRVIDAKGKQLASVDVTAGIHVLVAADIDGDGTSELLTGWGQSREFMNAKARVSVFRLQGGKLVEDVIATPESERAEVATMFAMPDEKAVFVAYFDSKFHVTSAIARKAGTAWQLQTLASLRMATSYGRSDVDGDGTPDLVVGRMYGDGIGNAGDAFVLALDGTRTPLPTTRGLRSLAVIGSDIFMGDGWHQNYGRHARGRLTHVTKSASGFRAELVEDTPGQYAIERIVPATIDGAPAVVALGSHYVRVYKKQGGAWRGLTIAGAARDVAVGDLDGKAGDEILVVGDQSTLVDLAGVAWP
jgi:hypothetical protein